MIIQNSCSELLVDTAIHDPEEAFRVLMEIAKNSGWEFSPPLSIEELLRIKKHGDDSDEPHSITVYDCDGSNASLRYGDNGYAKHGFYVEADDDCDRFAFPILEEILKSIEGSFLKSYDGGSTCFFKEWQMKEAEDEADND